MPELVTMRITVDPVLKEQLKVRAIERGMTHAELLPKLLAQGLRSEPDKADAAPTTAKSGQAPKEPVAEIEDAPPPEPSVQETVTRLLADHGARVTKAFGLIAEREERIEQLCNQQQGRFDKAVESIGKRAQQAVEHLGLHVDDKQALADAIGKHRGNVPHARDLLPGKDLSKDAAPSNAAPAEKQSTGKANDAGLTGAVQRDAPIPQPEKYLGLSL